MKITISERAEMNLKQIYKYIENKFSKSACNKFERRLVKVVGVIAENPQLFPASEINPLIRRCVVTKQTTLYYKIVADEIQIITLQDTRQDPVKLNLQI